ncbi:MAG: helix-turn-helix domain-containing protein [Verrucomicrobia bacterium]|nr:helix-turn-helix domain-containing protein [Verrucomicrobiota bacterium]MCH8511258.1 helix-turn-helix domain-containing protein [Kiritimatiellia bacterium]
MQKSHSAPLLIGIHTTSHLRYFHRILEAAKRYAEAQPSGAQVLNISGSKLTVIRDHPGPCGLLTDNGGVSVGDKPMVVVSHGSDWPGVVKVINDDQAIGRAAAWHLIDSGAVNLVCVDWFSQPVNDLRMKGFVEAAAEAGVDCEHYALASHLPGDPLAFFSAREAELYRIWQNLPPNSGLFLMSDGNVSFFKESLAKRGVDDFPGRVLCLGVDNLGEVPGNNLSWLSSVEPDVERIGQTAAQVLIDWIQSGRRPTENVRIPPLGVVARSSTFCSDRASLVRKAMERIRSGACLDDTAETLAASLGVSRVTLFRHFKSELGKTPHEVLHAHQLQRARTLLRETDANLETIANQCGYSHASTFIHMFQKEHGVTPGAFREAASDAPR